MAIARPARWRITLTDDTAGAYPVELPSQRSVLAGLVLGAMFAAFAAAWWSAVRELLNSHATRSVFDMASAIFLGGWVLGWSVGTLILGIVTVAALFMGKSLRVSHDALIAVVSLGPLKLIAEYERAAIYNLRIEDSTSRAEKVDLKFSYGTGEVPVASSMTRSEAEHVLARIRRLMPTGNAMPPVAAATAAPPFTPRPVPPDLPEPQPLPLTAPSSLALIVANLLPLFGVFSGHITFAQVMILFWSESAIIGFFTLLKMAVVGRWKAIFSAPFFAGHYGGFMAAHFAILYGFLINGMSGTPEPPAWAALTALYKPLWLLAGALFFSHAVSFALNFIGRGEYRGETVGTLMMAPYKRIVVLHLTLIFGGMIVMLVQSTAPAVAMLIGLKIMADLSAHTREHRGARAPDNDS
jgi:hypothetical protein